jgi:hypothetical protein
LRISGLEHTQQLRSLTNKDDHSRRVEEAEGRSRRLESLLQEAEMKREEEVKRAGSRLFFWQSACTSNTYKVM